MKKLISLMLTIAMLAALVPTTLTGVSAEDVTPPPPENKWTDEGNFDLSWCAEPTGLDGEITVAVGDKTYHVGGDWCKKEYEIDTPAKLAGLAYLSNKATTDIFHGEVFYITQNLDLSAHYWEPISKSSSKYRGSLIGKLDGVAGAAATITGMTIDTADTENIRVGLIGQFGGDWIENLRLVNAKITAHSYSVGSFVGYQNGNLGSGTNKQGGYRNLFADTEIVLKSGRSDRFDCVGGILGFIQNCNTGNDPTIITDCVFTGTISAPYADNLGGILGQSQYDNNQKAPIISNCVVISENLEYGYDNIGLQQNNDHNSGFGGIVGCLYSNIGGDVSATSVSNCYVAAIMNVLNCKDTTKTVENVGGIVGASCSQTKTYENCQFDGIILGSSKKKGAILGRYLTPATIKNCVVSGIALNADATQSSYVGTVTPFTFENLYSAIEMRDRSGGTVQPQICEETDFSELLAIRGTDGKAVWTKADGALYPILAVAEPYLNDTNKHLSVALSGADLSWFTFSGEKTLTNERELLGLSLLLKACGGKSEAFLNAQNLKIETVLLPLLEGMFDESTAEKLAGKTVSAVDSGKVVAIQAQTSKAAENGSYSVRFVAEIVGSDWASAGFDLLVSYTAEDGTRKCSKLTAQEVTACYQSVLAEGETVSAPDGHFYLVFVLNGIPTSNGDTTFTVAAHVEDAEGNSFACAGSIVFAATGNPVDAN